MLMLTSIHSKMIMKTKLRNFSLVEPIYLLEEDLLKLRYGYKGIIKRILTSFHVTFRKANIHTCAAFTEKVLIQILNHMLSLAEDH